MADARELIIKIRTGLKPLEERILRHRYLDALQTGRVAREKLRIFAGQQYHIIASDLRSIALLLSRHGSLASRPYILAVLEGENAAFGAFVAWLALYGSDAELAAAFAVNFTAWGANCGRISAALKAQYRLDAEAVSFFDLFANLPPGDDTALAVIQGGLDRGVASALIERAARLLQGYELMYWDTMAEAAL